MTVGPITCTLEPDLPWYLNKGEYGGKPVLTLGAHNIKFPYLERSEYGEGTLENGDVFLKNTFGSIYNGIASTWNDGMAGKEGSAMVFEGDHDVESAVRHIFRGKATTEEFEGLAAMAIIHKATGKTGVANEEVLNPKDIHFMQSSIKNATGEFTVLGNAEALANGSLSPEVLRINVWKDANGKIWTLDHRRLGAFKLSGLQEAPVNWATSKEVKNQMWKMTTKNGGTSVKLKLGDGTSKIIK